MARKAVKLIIFLIAFNTIEHWAHVQTKGFSLHRVQFETPTQGGPSTTTPELEQTYRYFGCGNQCYAFLSEDGKYVLKLFKYANSPIPPALTKIPLLNRIKSFRPHRYEKTLFKRARDIESYRLAYQLFREESGLITAHLEPTGRYPTITLYDKLGCKHALDLSQAPFILQHKAVPATTQLQAWTKSGQHDTVKNALLYLRHHLKKRMELGLLDDDVNFYSNIGFVGETPIQIDPGHFKLGTVEDPDQEVQKLLERLP